MERLSALILLQASAVGNTLIIQGIRSSGDDYCPMHPWVIGTNVVVCAVNCEGYLEGGGVVHLSGIKG